MPIDLQRILETAVKATLEQPAQAAPVARKAKKRRLSTGRAILLGAGLATAGRAVVGHKGRDMLGRVQQRLADSEWLGDGEPEDAEEYEAELDGYEPEADDEEIEDDSPDEDQEPDADPDGEVEEAEPERPHARKGRQRRRS